MKRFNITILGLSIILSGCLNKEEAPPKILREISPPKEIEVFDLQRDRAEIGFLRSGTVKAGQEAYASPQITGKIEKVEVKIGQQVREGDILVRLDDSLNIDLTELQYKTAQKAENLSKKGEFYTDIAGDQALFVAEIGAEIAYNSYLTAIDNKKNATKSFQSQVKTLEIEIDNAKKAYRNSRDTYYQVRDLFQQTESDYEDFIDNLENTADDLEEFFDKKGHNININKDLIDTLEEQLNQQLSGNQLELANARFAMEIAKNREQQAQIALEGAKFNFFGETEQMGLLTDNASHQYQLALNQIESVKTQSALQQLSASSHSLQAESQTEALKLNLSQKTIRAPISGKIITIDAKEGNLVTPGQILLKIADTKNLKVKIALNEKEVKLVKPGDQVKIETETESIEGTITTISPSANEITKKIDLGIDITEANNLRPDTIVSVEFTPDIDEKLFIPLSSVFPENGAKFVRIINSQGKVQKIPVSSGEIIADYIEILAGLSGNEKIIRFSTIFLEEGEKVKMKSVKILR